MSRPAPLEVYVTAPDLVPGGSHHAMLFDPAKGKVLFSANAPGHDAALERLLSAKRMSLYARRRYVIKPGRPKAVLDLLAMIDACECIEDLDTGKDGTSLPMPVEDFITRIRNAITAIEQGARAVAA